MQIDSDYEDYDQYNEEVKKNVKTEDTYYRGNMRKGILSS